MVLVVAELGVVAVAGVPSSAALVVLEAAVAMRCRSRRGGDLGDVAGVLRSVQGTAAAIAASPRFALDEPRSTSSTCAPSRVPGERVTLPPRAWRTASRGRAGGCVLPARSASRLPPPPPALARTDIASVPQDLLDRKIKIGESCSSAVTRSQALMKPAREMTSEMPNHAEPEPLPRWAGPRSARGRSADDSTRANSPSAGSELDRYVAVGRACRRGDRREACRE